MCAAEQARALLLYIRRALYQLRNMPLPLEEAFIKAVLSIIIKHHFYFINEEKVAQRHHIICGSHTAAKWNDTVCKSHLSTPSKRYFFSTPCKQMNMSWSLPLKSLRPEDKSLDKPNSMRLNTKCYAWSQLAVQGRTGGSREARREGLRQGGSPEKEHSRAQETAGRPGERDMHRRQQSLQRSNLALHQAQVLKTPPTLVFLWLGEELPWLLG